MLRPNEPPLPFPWSSQLEGELRELRSFSASDRTWFGVAEPGS